MKTSMRTFGNILGHKIYSRLYWIEGSTALFKLTNTEPLYLYYLQFYYCTSFSNCDQNLELHLKHRKELITLLNHPLTNIRVLIMFLKPFFLIYNYFWYDNTSHACWKNGYFSTLHKTKMFWEMFQYECCSKNQVTAQCEILAGFLQNPRY